jgi:hypothetical protein
MAMGKAHSQPLTPTTATVGTTHVGLRPCLVDEHQSVWIEVDLGIEPSLAALQDIGAVLLAGVSRLFLRVIPRRWKNRRSVP